MDAELQTAIRDYVATPHASTPNAADPSRLIQAWRRAGRPGIERVKDRMQIAKHWATVYREPYERLVAEAAHVRIHRLRASCFSCGEFHRDQDARPWLPTGLLLPAFPQLPGVCYSFYAWPSITGGWDHPFLFCRACTFRFSLVKVLTGIGLP